MHEPLLPLTQVPHTAGVAAHAPQLVSLLVAPLQLRHLSLLLLLQDRLSHVSHVPYPDHTFPASSRQDVAIEWRKLDGVQRGGLCTHGEDWFLGVPGVPEDGVAVIVTGGEDAVVELVVGDLLDLAVVEVEVGKWTHLVALLTTADVPDRQLPVVAASQQLPLLVRVPLQRVPLRLVAGKDQRGEDADGLDALGGSAEADLVEEVDVPEGGAGGDEVGALGVVADAVHLPVVLDLVLHHDLVRHALVVLADGLRGTKGAVTQLPSQGRLVGQVDLGHDEAVLLLAGGVRAVEEVAEAVLVVGVSDSFMLVDPPLHAEGGPLQLLRVQRLVEVRGISAPDQLLGDVVVEGSLGGSRHHFLHDQAANYQYKSPLPPPLTTHSHKPLSPNLHHPTPYSSTTLPAVSDKIIACSSSCPDCP